MVDYNKETNQDKNGELGSLERYRLGKKIGRGGMGEVYKAYDLLLKRDIALKILWADHPDHIKRFTIEAQSQAKLKHDHICQVYDVGRIKGKPYIAMQFIDGQTLDEVSKDLTLPQKVAIMREIAEAVHEAHRIGLIHRDLKPANIMVERGKDGVLRSYVLDFGLAKETEAPHLTATGFTIGTPAYMSPEQVYGEHRKIDRRSDVFGLGATFYEFLTGRTPFQGESHLEIITNVLNENPVPPTRIDSSIPRDLDTIIMKCLEKEQSRRYDSARALSGDLQRYIDGEPIEARQASWTYRLRKKIRKNKTLSSVIAAALVLIAVFAGMGIKARMNAAKRAILAQNLGQELKEIESTMRFSHMLPLHDTREERAIVIEKMTAIEERIRELGSIGRGPGHYALGRGYLVLDRFDKAYEHLLKAWQNDYREPHAAYALARAMGELYEKELELIDKIPGEKLRKERKEKAEKEFREPILEYLKAAKDTKIAAPGAYVKALLAYYEEDLEKAVEYAKEAQEQTPWFYEARSLIGEIFYNRGYTYHLKGDSKKAVQMLKEAENHYKAALKIGRSDSLIYTGIAFVNDKLTEIEFNAGQSYDESLKKALLNSEYALKADADNISALEAVSTIYAQLANLNMFSGKDPAEYGRKAIAIAREGLEKYPDSINLYNSIGMSYDRIGHYKLFRNLDPLDDLKNAVQAYKSALTKDDSIFNIINNIGSAYWAIGYYELLHGLNPTVSSREGILHLDKALALDPELEIAHYNLGLIRWTMSRYKFLHGENPVPTIKTAISNFKNALKLNPDDALAFNGIGMAYSTWSEYELQEGKDPNENAKHALKNLEISIGKNPYYVFPYVEQGKVYQTLAQHRVKEGGNPRPLIARSIRYLKKAISVNPGYPEAFVSMARCHLLRAQSAKKDSLLRKKEIREGLEQIEKALTINPVMPEALTLKKAFTEL